MIRLSIQEEKEAPAAAAVTVPEKDKNGGFDVDSLDAALLRRLGGDYDFDLQAFFDEQRIGGTQSRLRWLAQAHGVLSEAEAELGSQPGTNSTLPFLDAMYGESGSEVRRGCPGG